MTPVVKIGHKGFDSNLQIHSRSELTFAIVADALIQACKPNQESEWEMVEEERIELV